MDVSTIALSLSVVSLAGLTLYLEFTRVGMRRR